MNQWTIYSLSRNHESLLKSLNLWNVFFIVELISNRTQKSLVDSVGLNEFWLKAKNEYGDLSQKAINKLAQFSTTYSCEAAFSSITLIKTKLQV